MYIKSDKFKSSFLKIVGYVPYEKYKDINLFILMEYLTQVNNRFKTKRLLNKEKARLYALSTTYNSGINGNNIRFVLGFSFLDSKYVDNDNYLNDVKSLIRDTLYNPLVINESFDEEIVEVIKRNMLTSIKAQKESSVMVAYDKAEKIMFEKFLDMDEAEEYIKNVNAKDLYEFYQSFLDGVYIKVYSAGNDEIKDFDYLEKDNQIALYNPVESNVFNKEKIDKASTSQCDMIIYYSIKDLSRREYLYTILLYNYLIGGAVDSYLFQKIREEYSFVYTIRSKFNLNKKIFSIYAGLSSQNVNKAKEEIFNIINNTILTEEDLKKSKESIIDVINAIDDSLVEMVQFEETKNKFNLLSKEDEINNINSISLDELNKIKDKLKLQLIYIRGDL